MTEARPPTTPQALTKSTRPPSSRGNLLLLSRFNWFHAAESSNEKLGEVGLRPILPRMAGNANETQTPQTLHVDLCQISLRLTIVDF